jgi:lipopolysaccharide/colanic/teichoic acid biosynthesis glycosyltransferase
VRVRLLDRVVAAVGLVALSPLLAAVAVGVALTSPGPVLHRATRIGVDGRSFTLLKFRSMRVGSAVDGPAITQHGDERVTRVGRVLRATKLDELPQLWNVMRGDMAIVGPRPEDPRYVERYTPEQRAILRFPPGITSPASLAYRDEEAVLARRVAGGQTLDEAYAEVMADKLRIDLDYVRTRHVRDDVRIVTRTVVSRADRRRPIAPDPGGTSTDDCAER